MMLPTGVLLILGAVTLVAAAPSSRKTCCGPDTWESVAMATAAYGRLEGSKGFSGRMAVDHTRKLAALILLKDLMNMNMTDMNMTSMANMSSMTITMNNTAVFFYLVHNRRQEQQREEQEEKICSAWVLHNAISGLENRCFPNDGSSSFIDKLRTSNDGPSIPVDLIAYNYGGLARLLALQAFASAQDCSPQMFSMSTPSDGLKLTLALKAVSSGNSDTSLLNGPPALCAGLAPSSIDLGGLGLGLLDVLSNQPQDDTWVDDLVTLYVVSHIRDGHNRHRRDLSDVFNQSMVIEQAMELKKLLQAVQDFIGHMDDADKRRDDIEKGILLDKILSSKSSQQPSDVAKGILLDRILGDDSKRRSSDSDLEKAALLDKLLGGRDSRDDDVKKGVLLDRLLSNRDDDRHDDIDKVELLDRLLDDSDKRDDDVTREVLLKRLLSKRDDDDRTDDVKKGLLLDRLLSRRDDDDSHRDDEEKLDLIERLLSKRDDDSHQDDIERAVLLKRLLSGSDSSSDGSDGSISSDDVKKGVLLDRLLSMRDADDSRGDDLKKGLLLDQLLSRRDDDSHADDVRKGVLLDKLLSKRDDSHHDDIDKVLLEQLLGDRDSRSSDDDITKLVLLDRLRSRRDDDDSRMDDLKKIQLLEELQSHDDSRRDDLKKGVLLDSLLGQRKDDDRRDDVKKGLLLDELLSQRDDDSHADDVKMAVLRRLLMQRKDDASHQDDVKMAVLLDRLLSDRDSSSSSSSSDDDLKKGILLDKLLSQHDDSHSDAGVLALLFSRRSRRDLGDVFGDDKGRKSFDDSDVSAMVKFFIEKQLLGDLTSSHGSRRHDVDNSDLESLAELLVARHLLSGTKKDKQDQFIQAAQTMMEVSTVRDFLRLAKEVITYELLDQKDKRAPDLSRLVRLGALGAAYEQQKKGDTRAKTLLELLYLESQQDQSRH